MSHTFFKFTFFVLMLFLLCTGATTHAQSVETVPPKTTESTSSFDISEYRLLAPLPGFEKVVDGDVGTGGAGDFTLASYIRTLVRVAIGVIGILAVVMIVISGVQYMGSDVFTEKEAAKGRLTGAIFGLILAVSSVLILRTINPDLTSLSIGDDVFKEGVELTANTIDVPSSVSVDQYADSLPTTTLEPGELGNPAVLQYLAHQQGIGGLNAILWAAKNGYKEVPKDNPYTKSNVNKNMSSNFNRSSAQKNIGTTELTPANFLKHWSIQFKKISLDQKNKIEPSIEAVFQKVSSEDSVDINIMRTFCRIESYKRCTSTESITYTNSSGYVGLFQFGTKAWKDYGKGDRKNAYDNTKAFARFHKAILKEIKK